MLLSYHASHEQFSPADLLQLVRMAEDAGFDAAFSSDHFSPWASVQGNSGFAWSWMGAALQATHRISMSAITVPGGWRYHPAILAQAIATLGVMFPGRVPWVALGSGQLLNEHVVGTHWPSKQERNARLRDAAEIMRRLLAGETVTSTTRTRIEDAKIWSRPSAATRLVGAATSIETATWLAGWADGLLTTVENLEKTRRIIEAFREGGGAGKPVHLKLDVSWARSQQEAIQQAHSQWRFNKIGGDVNWEIRTPEQFDAAAQHIRLDDMPGLMLVTSDLSQVADAVAACAAFGVQSVDLHNVGENQREFIEACREHLIPVLRKDGVT
jgi:coenzyme F420-dependent glucose-6-phosphate dehydrogenase